MGYQIEQKVKGKTYLYDVESYWDKDKQQSRQRRTYLGRKDEVTGKLISTSRVAIPKSCKRFGGVFLLRKVITDLKLDYALRESFDDGYERYLHLAMYKILCSDPYYLYPFWQEDNHLVSQELDSQRISELLHDLGENDQQVERFFHNWIKLNRGKRSVMFDITSLSSYCQDNDLVEYGYNRDKEDLEQINLGIISKESNGSMHLPLAYRLYPGSINDVVTLENILEVIKEYRLQLSHCVLDRGFYSLSNIKKMQQKSLNYVLSVPFSTKLANQAAVENLSTLSASSNSFAYRKTVYYHIKKKISLNETSCTLHIYLDKEKKAREEIKLLSRLSELDKRFTSKQFKTAEHVETYISEITKSKRRYFSVKTTKGKFTVTRNNTVIDSELAKQGLFMIVTNLHDLDKDIILELYRSKDGAEKIFQSLKHDISEKRTRTKSLTTTKGSIFINFLALIILSRITQVMAEKNLFKIFSKQELFKNLDKLKIFTLSNGKPLLAEITKNQKLIFSAFDAKIDNPSYNSTGF